MTGGVRGGTGVNFIINYGSGTLVDLHQKKKIILGNTNSVKEGTSSKGRGGEPGNFSNLEGKVSLRVDRGGCGKNGQASS